MTMLRVAVCDDELLARKRMKRLLEAIADVEVLGVYDNAAAVLERARAGDVDVLLLDIQMPELTGIEAAALLGDGGPYVVFCTAYPDHALKAFETGAVDYLVKPIEPGRLRQALDRARARREASRPGSAESSGGFDRLAVSTRKGIVLVDPLSISHAVLEGELVKIACDDEDYLADVPLSELEQKLPRDRFERVHRRALLNLDRVEMLEPLETGGYTARMKNGEVISVSRQSARRLRKRFEM